MQMARLLQITEGDGEMKKDCGSCQHSFLRDGNCPKDCNSEFSGWKAINPKQNSGLAIDQKHYQTADMQPIEIMQAFLSPEAFIGYLRGNVFKYGLRIGHKSNDREDAGKLSQYAKWLCQAMDGKKINPREMDA